MKHKNNNVILCAYRIINLRKNTIETVVNSLLLKMLYSVIIHLTNLIEFLRWFKTVENIQNFINMKIYIVIGFMFVVLLALINGK